MSSLPLHLLWVKSFSFLWFFFKNPPCCFDRVFVPLVMCLAVARPAVLKKWLGHLGAGGQDCFPNTDCSHGYGGVSGGYSACALLADGMKKQMRESNCLLLSQTTKICKNQTLFLKKFFIKIFFKLTWSYFKVVLMIHFWFLNFNF